jgi:prolyl-tRNA synthetase
MGFLATIGSENETFFHIASGDVEIAHCLSCTYTERLEFAQFAKPVDTTHESPLPIEKISTPNCNTIEALVDFLGVEKEKTAKALMYTRVSDGKLLFIVVRGDKQLSEAKLKQSAGDVRAATADEIVSVGAVPGYASAVGLEDAVIVVDDQILRSQNLIAGANETGHHLRNTNYGRDYSAEIVADLVQVRKGDDCIHCGNPLTVLASINLATRKGYEFENILFALAQSYHDEHGLILPYPVAPFDVYLMHIPGKELDTHAKAEEIYKELEDAGISVLFDDRDRRAGVKFNDADLIGCPIRVTIGEKGLKEGMVELKHRKEKEKQLVAINKITEKIKSVLNQS